MNVAVVGLGFMGVTHLKAWRNVPGVRVYAVVDADEKRLSGDLSAVGGNLGGGGEKFDFSDVRGYTSLDEALQNREIDAVDICLPTNFHTSTATAALRAGKHVLVEKPIALDSVSAAKLCREAESAGRILMSAHVLRFFPTYVKLGELLKNAGVVQSAFFRRRCAAPAWSPWSTDPGKSGGAVLDLLIHDIDYCISLWGTPQAVRARGACDLARGIDVIHADLMYGNLGPVVISGGWHHPNSYPFCMEFTVSADAATFDWSSAKGEFRRCGEDGTGELIELSGADAFASELEYFAQCVERGVLPERCPPAQSAHAVALVEKMLESRTKNGKEINV